MQSNSITFGSTKINFDIIRSIRKTLSIVVYPNKATEVLSPMDISEDDIKKSVFRRAPWIIKQYFFFDSLGKRTPKRKYISGESHLYLGRQYVLRVIIGKPNSVKYKGRCFEIVCSKKNKAKELMNEWYKERAKVKFSEIAEPIIQRFAKYKVEPFSIYIQEMSSRWGSCTNKGKIILNTELIKAPRPCIEYVITHELCHLVCRNHNKDFFKLLQKEMPDWEKWKDKLEVFLM